MGTGTEEKGNKRNMKLYLKQVRLNQGGYDSQGRYFGNGKPLYHYHSEDYTISEHVRANNREEAKEIARKQEKHRTVSFFR